MEYNIVNQMYKSAISVSRAFWFCTLMLSLLPTLAQAANIYRYTDENGRMVWNSFIPAQYIKNGYTILNDRGQVIEVVPRALTEAELAAQAEALAIQKQQEEARLRQAEADNLLIRLYRSPDEIVRKRDDRLAQLTAQAIALRASANNVAAQVASYQSVVTNNENAGREAPAATLNLLAEAQEEKERLDRQLQRIVQDKNTTIMEAEREIGRLSNLLGMTYEAPAEGFMTGEGLSTIEITTD